MVFLQEIPLPNVGKTKVDIITIANETRSDYNSLRFLAVVWNRGYGISVVEQNDMLFLFKHTKLIRVTFPLLIFLASAGVTTLMDTCFAEEMDCCASVPNSKNDSCDGPANLASGILFKADFTCHASKVLGGLAIKLGLVEKENKTQRYAIAVALIIPSSCELSDTHQNSSQYQFAFAVPHPPPSVEKHVLNATFLI